MIIKFALALVLASSLSQAHVGTAIAKSGGVVQPQNRTSITKSDHRDVIRSLQGPDAVETDRGAP